VKSKIFEHILSIVFVSALLITALFAVTDTSRRDGNGGGKYQSQQGLGDIGFVEINSPFHRALLQDVADIFYPGSHDRNVSLVRAALLMQERALSDRLQTAYVKERLTPAKMAALAGMYVKFLVVYIVVMFLTYYGVQTLAVWQFVRERRRAGAEDSLGRIIARLAGRLASFAASMVLFSPAYVIAYSMRTDLNTDSTFFMALLGVISNGLLMVYATKFHAFLTAESRKGYVETALVKNLDSSYDVGRGGISAADILRPFKRFDGHVFDHIYRNARFQYISTIKEQAAFLITGLIIIEMALNIHGHLCYEMLRQMLYKNWDVVIAILLAIFYTVKLTELVADAWAHRAALRYENSTARP